MASGIGITGVLSGTARTWAISMAAAQGYCPGLAAISVSSNGVDQFTIAAFDAAEHLIRILAITRLANGLWTVA